MADENSPVRSLIRIGIVSKVDSANHMAKVYYPDMSNMVSDWLKCVYQGMGGAGGHKHTTPSETDVAGYHTHDGKWVPKVNDRVLVLMEYGFNPSGYILGVIP